jgi:hypothetical protein
MTIFDFTISESLKWIKSTYSAQGNCVGYLAHYVGIERVGVRIHPVGSRLAGMYPKGNCFPGY